MLNTQQILATNENYKMMSSLLACYPHPQFPTVSITGNECAFNCKHCRARYLLGMLSCKDPKHLYELCKDFAAKGARGILLSGGFNSDGYVPFEPFLDVIERIKEETQLVISIHTGLPPAWLSRELGRAGVDIADFDLIGDDETIREILGSDKTVADYSRTLQTLSRHIRWVVPHICIGLHAGKVNGEYRAVDIAVDAGSKLIVFLILIPTVGTPFQDVRPPPSEEILSVIQYAGERSSSVELALGCMRPKENGRSDLEFKIIQAGVSRIVLPSEQTLRLARAAGLQVKRVNACCSLPREWLEVKE